MTPFTAVKILGRTWLYDRVQYEYEKAEGVMTPFSGLQISGLDTIGTSDYDRTIIEDALYD